jgi:hypothetical protein
MAVPGSLCRPRGIAAEARELAAEVADRTRRERRNCGWWTACARRWGSPRRVSAVAVKGRAARTGCARSQFGPAWTDTDRNGCDTRNDILRRDLRREIIKAGTRGCSVLAGDLSPDPYTGTEVVFVRGGASEVDIDHVVALGDAWQKGAAGWVPRKRLAFANDPLNLLAVDASANRQKGDGDAATWLPGNKGYRCAYVARQVAVKHKYRLSVTAAERQAVARVLNTCPSLVTPRGTAPTLSPVSGVAKRAPRSQPPKVVRPQVKSKPDHGGASAVCNDGGLSYSQHRRGTS